MALGDGWLTVREALQLLEPDRSWMTDPLPKEQFTDWLGLHQHLKTFTRTQ